MKKPHEGSAPGHACAGAREAGLGTGRMVGLLAGLLASGCITTPLEDQSWRAVRTVHYDIWSSLGEEETRRLAISAERFRAAVAYLWGSEIPPAPVRTRIFAFDDRGVGRHFAFGRHRSYLLERHDGDVIVLRTGGSWDGDARKPLKLAYARRLIRAQAPDDVPPWLEEGIAQVASTVEARGVGASLGIPRKDHLTSLREEQWVPFDRLLDATDLAAWTDGERERFEEEAWALCHYLWTGNSRIETTPAQLAESPARIARLLVGDGTAAGLQRRVWKHLGAPELPSLSVRIRVPEPTQRQAALAEVLEELGVLALSIDAHGAAGRYLAGAQEAASEPSARVLAATGVFYEREGDGAEADDSFEAALELAPDDPLLRLARADQLRERAARRTDVVERWELAERAREHYRHAIYLMPRLPAAHAGLAATYLLVGEDPSEGREPALRARRLLPGDSAIRDLDARLALATRDWKAARQEALWLVTRARSDAELREARALLAEIDARMPEPGRRGVSE